VGPGDPDYVTVKVAHEVATADVIAVLLLYLPS